MNAKRNAIKNGMERMNKDEISDEFNKWVGKMNIYKDEMKWLRKSEYEAKKMTMWMIKKATTNPGETTGKEYIKNLKA